MREKVTEMTRSQNCQGCHATINPLGFSLEHFDAIGRWRTKEKNKPIVSTGEFIDSTGAEIKLSGARDLANYAATSPSAHASFIAQLSDHLAKQPAESYGPDTEERLLRSFTGSGFNDSRPPRGDRRDHRPRPPTRLIPHRQPMNTRRRFLTAWPFRRGAAVCRGIAGVASAAPGRKGATSHLHVFPERDGSLGVLAGCRGSRLPTETHPSAVGALQGSDADPRTACTTRWAAMVIATCVG